MGKKYRLIFDEIDELLQLANIWACFGAGGQACTTFCTHYTVQRAFKRRNILNGKEISLNFLQNRRVIEIFVYVGLFRRWKVLALGSACITQCKGVLNIEKTQRERNIA